MVSINYSRAREKATVLYLSQFPPPCAPTGSHCRNASQHLPNQNLQLAQHCQVSHCGLHGVSALHGALVDSYHSKVSCNALSGFNAVGRGACVRCLQSQVMDNEDGGVNVIQVRRGRLLEV